MSAVSGGSRRREPAATGGPPAEKQVELKHPIPDKLAEEIAHWFALLAEPMRIKLLDHLRERGEASVQELAEALDAGHANVSKHLNLLYAARIVGRRKEANWVLYRITDGKVFDLCGQVCGGIRDQVTMMNAFVPPAGAGDRRATVMGEVGRR